MARAQVPQWKVSHLLNLPAELRNNIYDHVASTSMEVVVFAHDCLLIKPAPLSQTCRQLRREYGAIHCSLPISHATGITIHNTNFSVWELGLSLQCVSEPTPGPDRLVIFRIEITDSLTPQDIQAFIVQLTEPASTVKMVAAPRCEIILDPMASSLNHQRVLFARLAKHCRCQRSDAEQQAWEIVYCAFAEAAQKVDGVSTQEYASGAWKQRGGGFAFI
ncbi:hypothetical protein B0A50_08245 [Salinomyces thailandicus]|uniref:Uncharacterized protein n=1 Tax=Salinomyces thailandicus TaxID=706561 RepID=A0A4U0TK81_9PEZI|nr:hypothetical protein B0A50_08245 [Salinomyces thailandica]